MKTRDDTFNLIREHGQEIRERSGVKRLAVFGATARGEAREPDQTLNETSSMSRDWILGSMMFQS